MIGPQTPAEAITSGRAAEDRSDAARHCVVKFRPLIGIYA